MLAIFGSHAFWKTIMPQVCNKQFVLKDDGSATPVFAVEQKEPINSQESSGNLILRSGFSHQNAEEGSVVSAALQLNGDCEKQCPEQAVDLHAIERISLDIPALVIVEDPQLTLPDRQDSIYRLDTMSDFLATLFSCRVDEVITCDHSLCHYTHSTKTGCKACLGSCKIESLSADNATYSLCWNGSLCVGCQSCVEACPEEALTYRGGAVLTADYFRPVEVSRADPMVCEGCGKVFGTKKSFEKVIAILAAKQQTPAEHLHYCEDCRVVKLLEDQ